MSLLYGMMSLRNLLIKQGRMINRGVTYAQQGEFTQAMSDYNKAIEINPNDAETYNNRGNTGTLRGNFTSGQLHPSHV